MRRSSALRIVLLTGFVAACAEPGLAPLDRLAPAGGPPLLATGAPAPEVGPATETPQVKPGQGAGPAVGAQGQPGSAAGAFMASASTAASTAAGWHILWQNTATSLRGFWPMDGVRYAGGWDALGEVPSEWDIAGSVDMTGDGEADVVWQNTTTGIRGVWPMNGTTYPGGWLDIGEIPPPWDMAALVDMNGDGKADIVWQNRTTGDRGIYTMNGVSITGWHPIGQVPGEWDISAVADFTGDGRPDLLWHNRSTGALGIWPMNGLSYAGGWHELGVVPAEWTAAAAGDFTGDGKADILWHNTTTGLVGIWPMQGATYPGGWHEIERAGGDWRIAATRTGAPPVPRDAALKVTLKFLTPATHHVWGPYTVIVDRGTPDEVTATMADGTTGVTLTGLTAGAHTVTVLKAGIGMGSTCPTADVYPGLLPHTVTLTSGATKSHVVQFKCNSAALSGSMKFQLSYSGTRPYPTDDTVRVYLDEGTFNDRVGESRYMVPWGAGQLPTGNHTARFEGRQIGPGKDCQFAKPGTQPMYLYPGDRWTTEYVVVAVSCAHRPGLDTLRVTTPTYRDAIVTGGINTYGLAATYWLEYSLDSTFAQKWSTAPRAAAASTSMIVMSDTLRGLTGGGTYYMRGAGTNDRGTNFGPVREVVMPASTCVTSVDAPFNATVSATLAQASCLAQDSTYSDRYKLVIDGTSNVTIEMTSTAIDAVLDLMSASGQLVARDDSSAGGSNARIARTLQPGTYFIRAGSKVPKQLGAYQLSVRRACLATEMPWNAEGYAADGGQLGQGDCKLADGSYTDVYRVQLPYRMHVNIDMSPDQYASNPLDTYLLLTDSTGMVMAQGQNANDATASIIGVLNAGTYYVFATSTTPGATGDYSVSVRDRTCYMPTTGRSFNGVRMHLEANAVLNSALDSDDCAFTDGTFARSGEFWPQFDGYYKLMYETTAFDAWLGVFQGSTFVGSTGSETGTSTSGYLTVEGGKAYTMVLGTLTPNRFGAFKLSIVDNGCPVKGTIVPGTPVTGTSAPTDCLGYTDAWALKITTAGTYQIDLASTAFDPRLTVSNSAGTVLGENHDASTSTTDARVTLTLAAGTYYVWMRNDLAGWMGSTWTGNYTITATRK